MWWGPWVAGCEHKGASALVDHRLFPADSRIATLQSAAGRPFASWVVLLCTRDFCGALVSRPGLPPPSAGAYRCFWLVASFPYLRRSLTVDGSVDASDLFPGPPPSKLAAADLVTGRHSCTVPGGLDGGHPHSVGAGGHSQSRRL